MVNELNRKITPRKSPILSMNQRSSEFSPLSLLTRTPRKDKNTLAGNDSPIEISSNKRKVVDTSPNGSPDHDSTGGTHKRSRKKDDRSGKKKKSKYVESEEDTAKEQRGKIISKGKAKVDESVVHSDYDFMDEIPTRSGKNVNLVEISTGGKPQTENPMKKSTLKKSQKDSKNKKRHTHWKSYINVDVFDQLRERFNDQQFQLFKESPFGFFLDLHRVKVQPQLIRHILLKETKNDRDDMFIVNVNNVELHFGIREFWAITGLKCGVESEFVSDSNIPNRLMDSHFYGKKKVSKQDIYEKFKAINDTNHEDFFKIGLLYFIESYLFAAEPKTNYVNKLIFDLVESGEYRDYTWGNLCFRILLDKCSHKLENDPSFVIFGGFHLALQIWWYECCSRVDPSVAQCKKTTTPRILNWQTPDTSIKYDYLRKTMFRKYNNQIKFSDIALTREELDKIDPSILPEHQPTDNHDEGFKKSPSDEESYFVLKNEIINVRQDFKTLELKVDENLKELKEYIVASINQLLEEIRSSRQQPCGTRSLANEFPMSDEQVNPRDRSMSKDQHDEETTVHQRVDAKSKNNPGIAGHEIVDTTGHERVDAISIDNQDSETVRHERVDAMSTDNQDAKKIVHERVAAESKNIIDTDADQSSMDGLNLMDLLDPGCHYELHMNLLRYFGT